MFLSDYNKLSEVEKRDISYIVNLKTKTVEDMILYKDKYKKYLYSLRSRMVINETTGEVFDGVVDASKEYRVSQQYISKLCSKLDKSNCGMKWYYEDEYNYELFKENKLKEMEVNK